MVTMTILAQFWFVLMLMAGCGCLWSAWRDYAERRRARHNAIERRLAQ
jgi:hypothetical protein